MSRANRPVVLLAALTLTVAACSGDDAPPPTTTLSTVATTTTSTPPPPTTVAPGGNSATTSPPVTTTATTTSAPDDVLTLAVDVEKGIVTGGGRQTLSEGTIVRLVVTVDAADFVLISGFDLRAPVAPDSAAVFDFAATETGVFAVELEDAGLQILELEVVP